MLNLQRGNINHRTRVRIIHLLSIRQQKTIKMKFDIAIIAYDENGNQAQRLELENLSMIVLLGVILGFPRKKYASMVITIATAETEESVK